MTTLIALYSSNGCEEPALSVPKGRCDARCYTATSSGCNCVCGGMNHGVGEKQAFENTRQHAEKMLETYAKLKNLTDYWGFVPDGVRQIPLFEEV